MAEKDLKRLPFDYTKLKYRAESCSRHSEKRSIRWWYPQVSEVGQTFDSVITNAWINGEQKVENIIEPRARSVALSLRFYFLLPLGRMGVRNFIF